MKKQDRIIEVSFKSSGHYKVTVTRYNKEYSHIITDMQTIDNYKDGKVSAAIALYDMVIRNN